MVPPPSLDYWRGFFSGARASIFDTIDAAIRVAAADHPDGLRARRDAIAERLYTALTLEEAPGRPATGPPPLLNEGAGSVPSLCSFDRAEGVVDDGGGDAVRRGDSDEDPVVAEALRVMAALSAAQDKVRPWVSYTASVLDLLVVAFFAASYYVCCVIFSRSRRPNCLSCSGGCGSWNSRWTPSW
jgi:hypothetical protein